MKRMINSEDIAELNNSIGWITIDLTPYAGTSGTLMVRKNILGQVEFKASLTLSAGQSILAGVPAGYYPAYNHPVMFLITSVAGTVLDCMFKSSDGSLRVRSSASVAAAGTYTATGVYIASAV